MEKETKLSPFPFEGVMSEIEKLQGNRAAIVILEAPNGSTTYLRHNISEEGVANLLRSAYQQRDVVHTEENKADLNH